MKYFQLIMIAVFIAIVFVGKHLIGGVVVAEDQTLSLSTFINNTHDMYLVYTRAQPISSMTGPVYSAASLDWKPTLILRPQEEGVSKIILQDVDTYGAQVKIAPVCNQTLPTFYINGGINASGDCGQKWFKGPYSINVSLDERAVNSAFDKRAYPVRYCCYRNGKAIVEIYHDGIQFKDDHNLNILDENKITLKDLKKGCKS